VIDEVTYLSEILPIPHIPTLITWNRDSIVSCNEDWGIMYLQAPIIERCKMDEGISIAVVFNFYIHMFLFAIHIMVSGVLIKLTDTLIIQFEQSYHVSTLSFSPDISQPLYPNCPSSTSLAFLPLASQDHSSTSILVLCHFPRD
jgi:hypothetical protein